MRFSWMLGMTVLVLVQPLALAAEPSTSSLPWPDAGTLIHARERDRMSQGSSDPKSVADLKVLEERVQSVVERVAPAVVALQIGSTIGSGVVISRSGLVLTVAHVVEKPGRSVTFFFPNGRKAKGETLGANHDLDAGLARITEAGEYPFAWPGDLQGVALGDWLVTLGHPGGFEATRPVVARLGRLIWQNSSALQSDCTLMAGDSGGPLFDLSGRIVGIHSRISGSTSANYHVPITAYREHWDRLTRGESWGQDDAERPRPWLGTRGIDHPEGCELERVDEAGPAFKAGLRVGDVVLRINGARVEGAAQYAERVQQAKPGDALTVTFRRDQDERSVPVTVGVRPR